MCIYGLEVVSNAVHPWHIKGHGEKLFSDRSTRRPLSQVTDLSDYFLFASAARKLQLPLVNTYLFPSNLGPGFTLLSLYLGFLIYSDWILICPVGF